MKRVPAPALGAIGAGLLLLLVSVACSKGTARDPVSAATDDSGGRITYVALGSRETSGLGRRAVRDVWPQLLYRESLPRRAVFVNLARDQATVTRALDDQLPITRSLDPTIVTLWFGTADAFAATPPDRFAADLERLVRSVSSSGARVIVILGPPPEDGHVDTAPYTAAAAEVARRARLDVVDLRTADVTGEEAQAGVAAAVAEVLGPVR